MDKTQQTQACKVYKTMQVNPLDHIRKEIKRFSATSDYNSYRRRRLQQQQAFSVATHFDLAHTSSSQAAGADRLRLAAPALGASLFQEVRIGLALAPEQEALDPKEVLGGGSACRGPGRVRARTPRRKPVGRHSEASGWLQEAAMAGLPMPHLSWGRVWSKARPK